MIDELELLIGLAMEAKETNRCSSSIVQKARELNHLITPKVRKDVIMPIMHSSNADDVLQLKINDYFNRQRMRRGVMH